MTHTSDAALESIDAKAIMQMVHQELQGVDEGLTSEQVADRIGLSLQSVTPRLAPLEREGKVKRIVVDCVNGRNRYKTRAGASGRARIIWYAV